MADLHLWVQAWADEGATMLFSVESTDKYDNSTLAVDCSKEEFSTIEASLYQVWHRTTANEPLRMVQQIQGPRGVGAWRSIMRRYDQRNMSDTNSPHAQLVSNISERDRSKDVEHFEDILTTCVNETSLFENSFGKIRDKEQCSQSSS